MKSPAAYSPENTPTTDLSSEQNSEAENRLQDNANFNPVHMFSVSRVESPGQSLSITDPPIPVNNREEHLDIKGNPLSLIHQKNRFKDLLSLTPYFSRNLQGTVWSIMI